MNSMNLKATEIHRHTLRTLKVILEIIFSSFQISGDGVDEIRNDGDDDTDGDVADGGDAGDEKMMTEIQVVLLPCAK